MRQPRSLTHIEKRNGTLHPHDLCEFGGKRLFNPGLAAGTALQVYPSSAMGKVTFTAHQHGNHKLEIVDI